MVGSYSKGQFQGRKGQIWAFVIYLHWYLRNSACYDQSLYDSTYSKSYMIFQFASWYLTLDDL